MWIHQLSWHTNVTDRRLDRLEKENSRQEDEEQDASLTAALSEKTKVVKLFVGVFAQMCVAPFAAWRPRSRPPVVDHAHLDGCGCCGASAATR